MRRFLAFLTVLSLLVVPTLAQANAPIRLIINNVAVQADVPPVIENDRTLVPIRALSEPLGFTVSWDDATETVTLTRGETVIKLTVGKQEALVGDKPVLMDVPAVNRDGRVLIPVRFVSEQLGAKVEWDGTNRTVSVAATVPAPTPVVDPAALELLSKVEALDSIKATGEFEVTVAATGLTMTMNMGMEMYAKGEESLTYTSISMFGESERTGTALYQGQIWQQDAEGVWTKLEDLLPEEQLPLETPTANPIEGLLENPASLTELDQELLKGAEVTVAEKSFEGVTYDVVTVTLDEEALDMGVEDEAMANTEANLSMDFWLTKGTGLPHHMDILMHMVESELEMDMTMDGTFFFEPLEEPIPFPAEILEGAAAQP